MKKINEKYGNWAIIAGAAEGLGKAYAIELAKRGMNLVLVDSHEEKLYSTAMEVEEKQDVRIKRLLLDLSVIENINYIFESLEDIDCRLLVYNAAYGPVRRFLKNTPEELDYHINLNCRTPLHLVYHFVGSIPETKKAGIILMSSLAGLIGTNLVSVYGATKAFNWNLAESLHYELKPKGIDVMACCAGATDTPNYRNTKPEYGFPRPSIADPENVAATAINRLGKKALYIPGWNNLLTWFFMNRVLPRKWSAHLMNRTMYRMYKNRI